MGNWVAQFLSGGFLLLQIFSLSSYGSVPSLEKRFELEFINPGSGFSDSLKTDLAQKHIVFVDGIMNELASIAGNYFNENIEQVNTLGITTTHLQFSSRTSIPANADALYDQLRTISDEVKKPIILVGHSMGGAEALFVVLKHPELLYLNTIEKVVLIQGAIGGSALADNMADNLIAQKIKDYLGEGLKSLSPQVAQANFRDAYSSFQTAVAEKFSSLGTDGIQGVLNDLSKRVFYVRGAHHPAGQKLSMGLDIVMLFLKSGFTEGKETDGLMDIDNQILGLAPLFGIDLGVLEADHIELVVSGLSSHSDEDHRKAFTRGMLQSIYDNPDELLTLSPKRVLWE